MTTESTAVHRGFHASSVQKLKKEMSVLRERVTTAFEHAYVFSQKTARLARAHQPRSKIAAGIIVVHSASCHQRRPEEVNL